MLLFGVSLIFIVMAVVAIRIDMIVVPLVAVACITFAISLAFGEHMFDPAVSWSWGFGWALILMFLGWALGVHTGAEHERGKRSKKASPAA
jgi:hypothetical protein